MVKNTLAGGVIVMCTKMKVIVQLFLVCSTSMIVGTPISNYILEISYNVRHFEKHGRDLQDPWSSRQSSVYQSYSHRNNTSIWILIQIPSRTRSHLERLNSEGEGSSPDNHPMDMHLHLLVSCEKNWGPYIGYLGNEVSLIVSPSTLFPNVPGQYYVVVMARINSTSDRSKAYVFERNSLSMCRKARTQQSYGPN